MSLSDDFEKYLGILINFCLMFDLQVLINLRFDTLVRFAIIIRVH